MSTAEEILAQKTSSGISRPTYTWEVPDAVRLFPGDPKSFTMTPYTMGQEIDAIRIAKATEGSLQNEFIKKAVVELNGSPVVDLDWLDKTSPGTRQLISSALDTMLLPTEKAIADFRASLKRGAR